MDCSKNGRWIIPFKKVSRLRVNMMFNYNYPLFYISVEKVSEENPQFEMDI